MKISREGLVTIFIVNLLVSIGLVLVFALGPSWLGILIPLALIELLVIYFFRDPDRDIPQEENLIVSPADGKVVLIKDVFEDQFLKSEATQVSIFLSVFNVHVNRYPIAGILRHVEYKPGKFMVAWDENASVENEQTVIGVEHPKLKLLFKPIAGLLARRIVFTGHVNDSVKKGDRCGIIKFGSRVDIILPKNVDIKVKVGDITTGGVTVIGTIR